MNDFEHLTYDERSQLVTLLEALETGWCIVDDAEDFDYVLLVNESRSEMEGFTPSKKLIHKLERMGLIVDPAATFGSRPRETLHHHESSAPDWEVKTIETLLPIVYLYKVTPKGREYLGRT